MSWPSVTLIVASHLLLREFLAQPMIGLSCRRPLSSMGQVFPIHPKVQYRYFWSFCFVQLICILVHVIGAICMQASFIWLMRATRTARDIYHLTRGVSTITNSGDVDLHHLVKERYLTKLIHLLGPS